MAIMRLPVVLHRPQLPMFPLVVRGLRRREPDMRKPVATVAVLIVCAVCQTSPAEDPAVAAAYGAGVHDYYSGNHQQSYDTLSRVVAIGTDDPRVYYFRGLAALQLGRRDEAIADFSEGGDLEAAGWSIRTVSRSLERVQGPDRLLLERSRTRARLAIAQPQRSASGSMRSAGSGLSGPRYSGIGGSLRSLTEEIPEPPAAEDGDTYGSRGAIGELTVPAANGRPLRRRPIR